MPTTEESPHNPLIKHIYTADPSAHVFNGKLYIYPSHDIDTGIESNDNGDQYDMNDYHVFSIDSLSPLSTGNEEVKVKDHGVVLSLPDVPWASKQLWAPDAAFRDGKYYLYFPARDTEGRFRVGVAVSMNPEGPFRAERAYLGGSYSIDPAVFIDDVPSRDKEREGWDSDRDGDGKEAYIYFGGLWGGQLEKYTPSNDPDSDGGWKFNAAGEEPSSPSTPALGPRVAKLSRDMLSLASPVKEITILDESRHPIASTDHSRRFFEASWLHKYAGVYYFSYSTGDTHYLVYATSSSPWGPFMYRGRLLEPVLGWTTHHSIVEFEGRWWLFYHDCEISNGVSHLRNVKVREIEYLSGGEMVLVD
ncbi:glycoside hydrolase family 43 protein [Aspergillus stella-maris]|uniref:glycoside hydrolase family 43 protein n=1 Tax=Aspergillus stella-maris TaxID=1810926 RepID=UPI003CCCDF6E